MNVINLVLLNKKTFEVILSCKSNLEFHIFFTGIRPLSERALQLLIASGRNTWVLPFERLVSTTSIINFLRLWSQMLHLHGSWASRSVETALNFARQWPNKGVPRVLIIFAAGHNTAQLWAKMHLVRGVVDRVLVIKAGASSR